MRKKALRKDFFMEIRKSIARFLSIFFIVALGVAFFSGIQAASPDMRYTGDAYFDAQELMDVKVISTLGLNEENIQALLDLPGIVKAEGGIGVDLLMGGEEEECVIHVETMTDSLNQLSLTEGRLPKKTGECFVDSAFMENYGYKIGDVLEFYEAESQDTEEEEEEEGEEFLKVKRYTIVGKGHSPLYISFNRGNTNLGSGEVRGFAYVTRENFTSEYDTQVYLQAKGALGLTSYTDAYDNLIKKVQGQVEGLEEEQCLVRYEQVQGEAQEKVDDAKKELEDGKKEAQEELDKAWKDIEDGEKELEDGKKELADGEKQLSDAKQQLADGRNQLASARQEIKDGEAELASARTQIANGQAQLKEAYNTLDAKQKEADAAKAKLEDGKAQLDAAQKELDEKVAQYQQGMAALEAQEAALSQSKTQLEEAKVQYEQAAASGEVPQEQLDQMLAQITQSEAQIVQGEQAIAQGKAQLEAGKPQLDAAQQQIDTQKAALEASQKEFDQGAAALASGWNEYYANEKKLKASQQELSAGEAKLAAGRQEIAANEAKLSDAQAQITANEGKLADARQEIADGEKELAEGKEEYEKGKKEAEEEIAEAEEKLADAQKKVDEIEKPQWIISNRDDLPEYADYGSNADRIRNIGEVFPAMFFLVAALISLTTMTRMVEEQRTQIGTLKALGYSKRSIASKYLLYALLATLGGSILGVLIGEKFLPYVIIKAYGIMYHNMATHLQIRYEFKYALLASVTAVICTVAATLSSCIKELAETPASLMRPPAPKEGKRVFLELLPFIWNRLNFTWKSTVRNLFRYKKRFFMTIFGIGGCMALLLVGFGLRDSIMDITMLQYEELQKYDGMVIGEEDATEKEKKELFSYLEEQKGSTLADYVKLSFQKVSSRKEKVNLSVYLYVVEQGEELEENIVFRNRKTKEIYHLTDEGAVISEKTAALMGISIGDKLEVELDGKNYQIPVAVITENYMGHYAYLIEALYTQVFGEKPVYDDVLLRMEPESAMSIEDLGKEILEYPAALSLSYTSSMKGQMDRMLSSLDTVMIVLIVSAGMLAFVVLYNLNNINITERKRELATLKVLGFYDMEVCAYVFRENVLLTFLGAAAGCGMGILLHRFVISTVEVDAAMFGRNIYFPSFLYSILFTIGFSLFVNFVMYFKLKKIDMVESLKSVE